MDQLKATLQERSKVLQAAYTKAKKADRMKTAFLHNMTNQMLAPAESISKDVEALGSLGSTANAESIAWMVDDIQQSGDTIAEVLKNLLNISDEEKEPEEGKEVTHV
jgi:methyl-accepting chemotaxis protein